MKIFSFLWGKSNRLKKKETSWELIKSIMKGDFWQDLSIASELAHTRNHVISQQTPPSRLYHASL